MVNLKLSKLISTYELPDIPLANPEAGALRLAIQIFFTANNLYTVRVLRKDIFDIRPHFSNGDSEQGDWAMEEIFVSETSADWEKIKCPSEEEALQSAIDELRNLGVLK